MNNIDATFDKILKAINKEEMDKEYTAALKEVTDSKSVKAAMVNTMANLITHGGVSPFLDDVVRIMALAYISGRVSVTADLEKEIK